VNELKASIDDPDFPQITCRRGASGVPTPVIRGTGIRVETLVVDGFFFLLNHLFVIINLPYLTWTAWDFLARTSS
jgi:hypothetical protein